MGLEDKEGGVGVGDKDERFKKEFEEKSRELPDEDAKECVLNSSHGLSDEGGKAAASEILENKNWFS